MTSHKASPLSSKDGSNYSSTGLDYILVSGRIALHSAVWGISAVLESEKIKWTRKKGVKEFVDICTSNLHEILFWLINVLRSVSSIYHLDTDQTRAAPHDFKGR